MTGHLKAATAIGSGVVALAVAVSTLVFNVFPALIPEKNERSAAEVKILGVDRGIRAPIVYGPETRACRSDSSSESPRQGVVVNVEYHVEGYKHATVKIRCGVFDADLDTPIDEPAFGNAISLPAQSTTNDTAIVPVWVAVPSYPGSLRVRVQLDNGKGELLAYADSPDFPGGVLASPAVRAATHQEEGAIVGAILRSSISVEVRDRQYITPVAVLQVGGAISRGAWAIAEMRSYARFHEVNASVDVVLHRTHGKWHVIKLEPSGPGCDIPEEVLLALGVGVCK